MSQMCSGGEQTEGVREREFQCEVHSEWFSGFKYSAALCEKNNPKPNPLADLCQMEKETALFHAKFIVFMKQWLKSINHLHQQPSSTRSCPYEDEKTKFQVSSNGVHPKRGDMV
ncbi:hypothetical protein WMY93_015391 [Mugilogobius chulae]|uniref:Uncharacterized protein n=1 Tax=Mugilogobius chulae TaxID=88201 RepID=A0AAW0P044_9GOBI